MSSPQIPCERDRYLSVVDQLLAVDSSEALLRCLTHDLTAILPFGCMVGGLGRLVGDQVLPEVMLTHGFPCEYLDSIRGPSGAVRSPLLTRWLRTHMPLAFEFNRHCDQLPSALLAQTRRFELRNVLAHGHYMPREGLLTYFSFHRLSRSISPEQRQLIARLMPHLHCAASRIRAMTSLIGPIAASRPGARPQLSQRQQEIVHWLSRGKTNWEISQLSGTSEANVKYHLSSLMRLLSVSSRASLVFKLCASDDSTPR